MARRRRPSTVRPASKKLLSIEKSHQNVEKMNGVHVGRMYQLSRRGTVLVRSIFRHRRGAWSARVKTQDGAETSIPLAEIVKALRTRGRHPVAGCYAVGPGRVRRRKVNRRGGYVVLYAQRPGGPLLKFLGRNKFARKGHAKLFGSKASAELAAWILRDSFPDALRGYKLFARS
jgi:hypothetical protein